MRELFLAFVFHFFQFFAFRPFFAVFLGGGRGFAGEHHHREDALVDVGHFVLGLFAVGVFQRLEPVFIGLVDT